jgi:hypothetical protein
MNFKSFLTLCISLLLMSQITFGQIVKPKKTMTPQQIEAFLKKVQKNKWQVTVKTLTGTSSGMISSLNGSDMLLEDAHPLLAGPCGVYVNKKWPFPVDLKEIVFAEKRNMLELGLRSSGEISFSAVFISIGLVVTPIIAVTDAIKKN